MPWLWLGTWSLGGEGFGPQDGRESRQLLERAFAGGVRHYDTAGLYAHGRAEALLAKTFSSRRAQVFLSTKGGLEWSGNRVLHRAAPADLRRHLKESLRRLHTDYLDLYQLHWPDPEVPLEESLDTLRELREEGLIRHWGAGNLTSAQVLKHIKGGSAIPHQVHHNPIHRQDEILNTGTDCQRCLNCVTSPLEQGLLGNGVAAGGLAALGRRDLRRRNPHFHDPAVQAWVERYRELAKDNTIPGTILTILWILTHPDVHTVIPGPHRTQQLDELLTHQEWMSRLGLILPHRKSQGQWQQSLPLPAHAPYLHPCRQSLPLPAHAPY
ncbi:MAG: aldo/keto reductase, partial [Gammaproteobacteria bacterium]|nr:aldo/keto reductase [Gammaproteobacteria bacterium]